MLKLILAIFRFIKNIFLIAILLFLVIFMVNNREVVDITLAPFDLLIETRIFILVICSFLVGFLFAILLLSKNIFHSSFGRKTQSKSVIKTRKSKHSFR